MRDQSGHQRRPSGRGLREVAVVPMQARRTREEESNRTRLMLYTGPPITLGNMRANGVRTLAAWCLGRGCNHYRVLDLAPNCAKIYSLPV